MPLLAVAALLPSPARAGTPLYAFGESRIAMPLNVATGTVVGRHYFTPQQFCGKSTCDVTSSQLYNKGSILSGAPTGSDIETTVDGLSTRVLLDGVPMTETTRTTVRNGVEVQLFRDGRQAVNGSLKPSIFNMYFSVRYKSGLLGDSASIYLAANVNYIDGTCSVPSQTVTLPKASRQDFRGIGSGVGQRPFSLTLLNCPAGYNRVGYQISPLNGSAANVAGTLKLRPDASAKGIGIRISDANTHTPLQFDRSIDTPYTGKAAPLIDIPLLAEYVQTNAAVTGGLVQAGALVLLDYQ
ncbi:fimbrial protein [Burkholderia anthina]|uniref:fimbrial protein n=1 Tax=Burkholderia anthina TaxID=179879 RepID=UPI001FC841D9|nr:fimbrial protein [Burkholderia anthina]